jgi:NAD-dependent DNA ligase
VKNQLQTSDGRYDKLFERLQAFKKVEHADVMFSLNASLKEEDVTEFVGFMRWRVGENEILWILDPNFGGISVEVIYREGRFLSMGRRVAIGIHAQERLSSIE